MIAHSDLLRLELEARSFRDRAFVIRSNHSIGAAVLMSDGRIFGGCNIESVISGLGVCAERAALQMAVAHGSCQPRALVIYDDVLLWPCGVCLQYFLQFVQIDGTDVEIITVAASGERAQKKLSELLPNGYQSEHLAKALLAYKK